MTLDPLLAAPLVVRLHALAAMAAVPLGAAQFLLPKGDPRHRALGWAWVVLMGLAALSALGITGRAGEGHWSWIHGMVALVAVLLPLAVIAARRGNVRRHRATMMGLCLGALLITGALTLTPGRVMYRVVFGG